MFVLLPQVPAMDEFRRPPGCGTWVQQLGGFRRRSALPGHRKKDCKIPLCISEGENLNSDNSAKRKPHGAALNLQGLYRFYA